MSSVHQRRRLELPARYAILEQELALLAQSGWVPVHKSRVQAVLRRRVRRGFLRGRQTEGLVVFVDGHGDVQRTEEPFSSAEEPGRASR